MELSVGQGCPSCGAAIVGSEGQRLLQCPFCGVRQYRVCSGLNRYVLPDGAPAHIPGDGFVYVPYLHCRGSVFSCIGGQVRHRVVDFTHLGAERMVAGLPLSLGLRPQAMRVSLLAGPVPGTFLPLTLQARAIVDLALQRENAAPETGYEPLRHEAFIGENVSCLYLPLFLQDDRLHDPVTLRMVAAGVDAAGLRRRGLPFQERWLPRYLATLCPKCGGSLGGERDSLVLSCPNCHTCWEEADGRLRQLTWRRIASSRKGVRYLPFWKITLGSSGVTLDSFGDFLRLTNQPLVVRSEHDREALCFWIPAFRIQPRIFLNLARGLTLSQMRLPPGQATMSGGLFPVTLPRDEAERAIKTVLAETAVNRRDVLPLLPKIDLHPLATELVYLPFNDNGHDLVQEQTSLALAGSTLKGQRSVRS